MRRSDAHSLRSTPPVRWSPNAYSGAALHRQGRTVVFIGHAGHAEVEGTLGQIDGRVASGRQRRGRREAAHPPDTPIAYITQTTLRRRYAWLIAAIRRRFKDVVGPETRDICYATQNRQTRRGNCRRSQTCSLSWERGTARTPSAPEIGRMNIPSYLVADATDRSPVGARRWRRRRHGGRISAGDLVPEVIRGLDADRAVRGVEPRRTQRDRQFPSSRRNCAA